MGLRCNDLTVQLGRFVAQLDVLIKRFPGWGTSLVVPLRPVVLELLRVAACREDLRQFRFERQVALVAVLVVAHLGCGVVFRHARDGVQQLGELGLRQSGVAEVGHLLEHPFQVTILEVLPVVLAQLAGNLLQMLRGIFSGKVMQQGLLLNA